MELVTGGAGFIGSHLVDSLVAKGKQVRVLDNFSSGREEFLSHHAGSGMVEVMKGDLLNLESVRSAMEGVDTVHHMAANPDIRLAGHLCNRYRPQARHDSNLQCTRVHAYGGSE